MATLAARHQKRPGWWRRFFDSLGERAVSGRRSGWIPWGWDAGIYPESMAGPFWPTMREMRRARHRHHPHPHRSSAHHHQTHRGASA